MRAVEAMPARRYSACIPRKRLVHSRPSIEKIHIWYPILPLGFPEQYFHILSGTLACLHMAIIQSHRHTSCIVWLIKCAPVEGKRRRLVIEQPPLIMSQRRVEAARGDTVVVILLARLYDGLQLHRREVARGRETAGRLRWSTILYVMFDAHMLSRHIVCYTNVHRVIDKPAAPVQPTAIPRSGFSWLK